MGGHLKNSAGSHRAPALADASSTQFSFVFFLLLLLQQHNNTPHTHGTNHLFPEANSRSYLEREYRNTRCFTFPPEKQNKTKHRRAFDSKSNGRQEPKENSLFVFPFFSFVCVWGLSALLLHIFVIWNKNMRPLSISHKAIDSKRFLTDNIKACVESARPLMKMMKTFSLSLSCFPFRPHS
jgi:hypothetical protein